MSARRSKIFLAAILTCAFVLRLASILLIPTSPTSDFWSYFQRAASLADKGIYDAMVGRPDASYPPAYPLLLSVVFRLPVDRLLGAKLTNVGLGVVAVVLIFYITQSLVGESAGLVAAAILAVSPTQALLPILIASENLFTPLLFAWILLIISMPRSTRTAFAAGLITGVLTLTRAIAVVLPLPWALAALSGKPGLRRFIAGLAAIGLGLAATLTPWAIRNAHTLGRPIFLTSTAGINLFIGNNPNAAGTWYQWTEDIETYDPDFTTKSIAEQDRIARNIAFRWLVQNPLDFMRLYLKKLASMFANDQFVIDAGITAKAVSPPWPPIDALPSGHLLRSNPIPLILATNAYYWSLTVLQALGLAVILSKWRHLTPHKQAHWMLIISAALCFPIASAIFIASSRFRWPMSDLLIPIAALALCTTIPIRRKL